MGNEVGDKLLARLNTLRINSANFNNLKEMLANGTKVY